MPEARRIDLRADYYRVLGLPENASGHEIRRAYRRLARQHHPDLSDQTGAADRFNAVSEAYQVLHDPDKRARLRPPGPYRAGVQQHLSRFAEL